MGSFSVLNNMPSINGINQLNLNNVNLNRTLNRLASAKRINTGADDAAGLQIADQLRGNVMAINQAVRNAGDGISVLQIADAALSQVTSMLWRSITLMEEAATGIMSTTSVKSLNTEYQALQSEILRIATATNFNGQNLLDGTQSNLGIFVGDLKNTSSYIYVNVSSLVSAVAGLKGTAGVAADIAYGISAHGVANAAAIALAVGNGVTISGAAAYSKAVAAAVAGAANAKGVSTNAMAATELAALKTALNNVSEIRGNIGASMNRLQATIDVLSVTSQNTLAAEDTIRSANMAEEISNMTKFQIMAQTGIAALAQANSNSQNVLGLLR